MKAITHLELAAKNMVLDQDTTTKFKLYPTIRIMHASMMSQVLFLSITLP